MPLVNPVASTFDAPGASKSLGKDLIDLSEFLGATGETEVSMDEVDGFLSKWGILGEGMSEGERL